MKSLRPLLAAAGLAVLTACSGSDLHRFGPACRVEQMADLPLATARNFLLAPVTLEGVASWMVIDTGAETSLITPEVAERLALAPDPGRSSDLLGVAGLVHSRNVLIRGFEIGGVGARTLSVGVGEIGVFSPNVPVAGLLGADVLSRFDVELNAPALRMGLYVVSGCTGFVPWRGSASAIPVRFGERGLTFLPLRIDDHPVRALLDTGARVSLMTRRLSASLGVTAAMLESDPARGGVGIGLTNLAMRQHRFDRVALGATTVRGMAIDVADLRLPGVEMLLGADWTASRDIWISYSGSTLFIR